MSVQKLKTTTTTTTTETVTHSGVELVPRKAILKVLDVTRRVVHVQFTHPDGRREVFQMIAQDQLTVNYHAARVRGGDSLPVASPAARDIWDDPR